MDNSRYKKYEPVFGVWYFERLIGEGSFGKVYEIRREDFGITYRAALKTITIPCNQSEIKSVMSDGMDRASAREYFGSLWDLPIIFASLQHILWEISSVASEFLL